MIVKGGEKTKSKKLLISILILLSVMVFMGCAAAQDANGTDLTIQDYSIDEVSPAGEPLENEAFSYFNDSQSDNAEASPLQNTNQGK